MQQKQTGTAAKWIGAIVVAIVVAGLVWLGYSRFVAHRHDTINVGVTDMPQSLDVRTADSDALNRLLIDNVYETLITVDENNTLQPGLASSWATSDYGLTFTLTIRSGVTFANGHALDASDVVYSLQQAVQNSYPNVSALGSLKSVTNPDATTVTIALSSPNPTLARALAGPLGIVYDAQGSYDFATDAQGSGPFTVSHFDAGKSLTLERNAHYWGNKAASKKIAITNYDSSSELAAALKSGDVDVDASVDTAELDGLKSASGITLAEGATTSKVVLAYNNAKDSLMSDEQIRKAFRYLINAADIAKNQPDSYAALGGPISQLEPGYEDLTSLFPYDLDKAKSMLGYFDLSFLPSVNLVVSEDYRDLAQTIANQIGQVAYPPVKLEVLSAEDYAKRMAAGTWELTIVTMDDTNDLTEFADPDSMFHYDHTDATTLYDEARKATSDDEWASKIKAYAKYLSEDAASDWLYTRKCFIAAKSDISGYPTALINQHLPLAKLA